MTESRKPRHIRDIAHLYISRPQSPSRGPRASLLVTSDGKSCFSGFHAANLAAAFAARRMNTCVFELSGLLPNAGYFMALPPRRYIRWNADQNEHAISALAGIKIGYSPQIRPGFGRQAGRPRLDLIHLPPVFPREPFRSALEQIRDFAGARVPVLLLGRNAGRGFELIRSTVERTPGWMLCCVGLDAGISFPVDGDRRIADLGHLGFWRGRLNDRIPVVLRVPESALARTYSSICETILFRINQLKRKAGTHRADGIFRQIRSG